MHTSTPAAAKINDNLTQPAMTAIVAPTPESNLRAKLELIPVTYTKQNEFHFQIRELALLGRFCRRTASWRELLSRRLSFPSAPAPHKHEARNPIRLRKK
jgi:hypothetical protein